jgi:hypothetical protein
MESPVSVSVSYNSITQPKLFLYSALQPPGTLPVKYIQRKKYQPFSLFFLRGFVKKDQFRLLKIFK